MTDKKYLLTALGTVAAASFSLSAMAADNIDPFQAQDLPAGFQVSADDDKEGKCGEGSCGEGDDKDKEGSCGEGSCGEGDDKDKEGSCGEGSCGEDDSGGEGACGEGSCGSV